MTQEEFEDANVEIDAEDLDEEDLDDDALDEDDALDDDLVEIDIDDVDLVVGGTPADVVAVGVITDAVVPEAEPKGDDEEDDGLELEEEAHPDDVEVPLDALLQERTAKATLEDDEEEIEEEEVDVDDRGEGPTKIMPRRPGEFLCSSCFLVLPRNQLADEARMLCRDCA